ncbi:MAG TPA: glycosyltransferase family 9 protein [Caldimonas sp.]|nr:glycosyltransferase family 9 protein [Caldimonas sp.]
MTSPPSPARTWRDARRLLAVRLDNLGDVLMTSPALAALRESLPEAHLTLLASPGGAALAPHLPMVEDVIAYRAPWVAQPGLAQPSVGAEDRALVERLASGRFDAAVVFTTCTQSPLPAALVCALAGIPERLAHCRENPYGLLTTWVRETDVVAPGMRHEVERQLQLVARVGCTTADERLRLVLRPEDLVRLAQACDGTGFGPGRPYIVVHPGASAPSRRWPAERFGAAAAQLAHATGRTVVFTGGADEQALVAAARDACRAPSWSFAGRLELGAFAALISGADLLLTNNSGPVHIAAALGTPVVDCYALTNPQHEPWRVASRVLSHEVPCRDCLKSICPQGHHGCLLGVTTECVVEAAVELLGTTVHRPRHRAVSRRARASEAVA